MEYALTEEEQRTLCQICGHRYQHLGSHVAKAHKMTAKEYKEEFGLDFKFSLISSEVKQKKRDAFEERREYYLGNFLKAGKRYRFKKGHDAKKLKRVSQQSLQRLVEQANDINYNARGTCPRCGATFDHLQSHLYNAHRLVLVDVSKL
jgi:hypothetical protein